MLHKNLLAASLLLSSLALGSVACTNNEEKKLEEVVPVAKAADEKSEFSVDDKTGRVDFKAEVVYFEYDDATLTNEGTLQLDALAKYMKQHPEAKLSIEGHCDNRGSVEYNLALGQRRSDSVRKYLTTVGVEESRLQTVSFGEEKPQETGEGESSWTKNRRAEFAFSNG